MPKILIKDYLKVVGDGFSETGLIDRKGFKHRKKSGFLRQITPKKTFFIIL